MNQEITNATFFETRRRPTHQLTLERVNDFSEIKKGGSYFLVALDGLYRGGQYSIFYDVQYICLIDEKSGKRLEISNCLLESGSLRGIKGNF